MSALDIQMRDIAKTIIAAYGKSMTLTGHVSGTYDTTTGQATDSTTSVTVRGVIASGKDLGLSSNTVINDANTYVMIAAQGLSTVPTTTDTLLIDGVIWTILEVNTTFASEMPVYYLLHVES